MKIIALLTLVVLSLNPVLNPSKSSLYQFNQPDLKINLPDTLREISGLTLLDNETIACVQDENGIVFFYNLKQQKIKRQIKFAENGDYESITAVDSKIFILRSDGVIFEIENYTSKKIKVKQHATKIPCNNNEGLCYHPESNSLLISAKDKSVGSSKKQFNRYIYSFNLTTKKTDLTPYLELNQRELMLYAKNIDLNLKQKTTKNGKPTVLFKINPSEIAIHPITKDFYILSATDYCLFIYSKNKVLKHIEQLNTSLFNKAEGLCFKPNGDLLISNEGKLRKANLLLFKYNP